MTFGDPDVFIHVECYDMLEPRIQCDKEDLLRLRMLTQTYDSFPALTSLMSALYVGIGELPVGKPSTNGVSAVGLKSLILRENAQPQSSSR
jgi:hypothetical protein